MRQSDIFNSSEQDTQSRLQLLYGNAIGGLVISLLCMGVLCFAFETPEQQALKTTLFIVLAISHTLRLIDNLYTRAQIKKSALKLKPTVLRFTIGIVANCLIWASYSFLMVPHMEAVEITVSAIIVSALAGGATTILAPSRLLAIAYMSSLILPFASMGLFSEFAYFKFVSFLGFGYWTVMIATLGQVSAFISETLALKNENTSLIKLMDEEKEEVDRMNKQLTKANQQLDTYTHSLETKVENRTAEIYRLSNLDPLTNLMNRNAFLQKLKSTLEEASLSKEHYALLFIDLDGFKDVNDGFGHKVGDAVLCEIAIRLQELEVVMGLDDKSENLLCRWGGDEFLVCTQYVGAVSLAGLVQDILSSISTPMSIASNNITLGASIGIAKYPDDSKDPHELIQYADISMYYQKKTGQGFAKHFTPELFDEFQHDQVIRDGLRSALHNREFSLVFQPIVDIENKKPWAIEALLRWEHKGQNISPAEFIPLAEKSGRIVEIGAWVLLQACHEAALWKFESNPSVSVNVSSLQLLDKDFINTIDEALRSSGLPADRLHLEITESVMLENGELAKSQLKSLADRGIHISIDDFGTGFSSLNQLQTMSFDIIKIDRSFLQGLNTKVLTIVSATKLIADEFSAMTVAEGIETETELAVLKDLGIRYIQGYLFARPMKSNDLKNWIDTF
ncbi:MAG: diguanylate cyclase (GGDEF)-like protein [Glaciecola sp.]|jgi:diguanylate cyclase (GGDEF)-like protein